MPEQADAFQKALREAGVRKYDWYPMIRGRLVAVNGRAVTPDDFTDDRAKRLVDREFNLSNASTRPRTTRWSPGAGPTARPARSASRRASPRR
jgi:putative ABC transport system permease protein